MALTPIVTLTPVGGKRKSPADAFDAAQQIECAVRAGEAGSLIASFISARAGLYEARAWLLGEPVRGALLCRVRPGPLGLGLLVIEKCNCW